MKISLTWLALRNMGRKRFRTVSIMLAGALACGFIFVGAVTISAVGNGLERGMARLGADIMVFPAGHQGSGSRILLGNEPSNFYMPADKIGEVAAVKGVDMVSPQLYITSTKLICCTMPTVQLVGYDPDTDFIVSPWVDTVRKTSKGDPDTLTLGANIMYAADGSYISFFGKRFKIRGAARKTGLRFIDFSAFMTMDVARKMIDVSHGKSGEPLDIDKNEISAIAVKLKEGESTEKVAAAINRQVSGISTVNSHDVVSSFRNDVRGTQYGILIAGGICWIMTLFLMGLVFTMIVNERKRELGLLRAMGAARNQIVRLVLSEAALLSGLSGVIGITVGVGAVFHIKKILTVSAGTGTIPFQLPSFSFIFLLASACLMAILVSGIAMALYPALRVGRIDPYDALRKI